MTQEEPTVPAAVAPPGEGADAAARKRGPGRPGAPAEPPPFKWKLIGHSAGVAVTLIKCIEREEVESQLLRLQQEGYYRELSIVPIEPAAPRPPPPIRPPTPLPKAEKPAPEAAKPAKAPAAKEKSAPAKIPPPKPAAVPKASVKSAKKPAAKKKK